MDPCQCRDCVCERQAIAASLKPPVPTAETTDDPVSRPSHYRSNGMEAIDVIQAFGLSFELGNVFKYIARAGKKPNVEASQDLRKAMKYLEFELRKLGK